MPGTSTRGQTLIDRSQQAPEVGRGGTARPLRGACRGLREAVLAALLAMGVACAATPPVAPLAAAPEPAAEALARPLVWSAAPEVATGRLYLLGSIHMSNTALDDLGPAVAAAWDDSSELVVEVDISQLDAVESALIMAEFGTMRDGTTLRDILEPETFEALEAFMADQGVPPLAYLSLKPWLASTMVAVSQLQASGLEAGNGVDQNLIQRAAGADKPIVELESFQSQMRMLDDLALDIQALMLEEALMKSEEVRDDTLEMLDSWRRGDEEQLVAQFFGTIEENPEFAPLYEKIFFERNEAMVDRLVDLSDDGRSRLVVVGAGHMLGPRGIPALLAARGYRVDKIPNR